MLGQEVLIGLMKRCLNCDYTSSSFVAGLRVT